MPAEGPDLRGPWSGQAGNSLRWARAIFAVMMTSSPVTLVSGSRVPCSSSMFIPTRNWSGLNGKPPSRRRSAGRRRGPPRVEGACELMPKHYASNAKPTICPGVLLRSWPWLRESRS